ncbi:DUF1289 domain-containing protein [Solimonas soli]|uniref:DUF1289 domain-containing protein n=1 Tax=Solimonas soli TaxID=413479 RepID=UPI0004BBFA15|nr:DUF1289 domain-containing protein [Solimonas soli]
MQATPVSADVESPCTRICRIGAQGHCVGCGRDLDEIVAWPRAGRALKLAIRERAAARLREHPDHQEHEP